MVTITDAAVRDTWQLSPSKFEITNATWQANVLQTALTGIKSSFGLPATASIQGSLYKLLLYEKGSHFKPHKDSEKETGMFATLVIVLPSVWTGGELIIRHKGSEVVHGYSSRNAQCTQHVAFYADCEHEVKPLTSGYRLCLVYNVCWVGTGAPASLLRAPDATMSSAQQLSLAMVAWQRGLRTKADSKRGQGGQDNASDSSSSASEGEDEEDEEEDESEAEVKDEAHGPPKRLFYLLEHEYTPKGISETLARLDKGAQGGLKGRDGTALSILWQAMRGGQERSSSTYDTVATLPGIEAYIVQLEVHQSLNGYADDGDCEMEVEDSTWTLGKWTRLRDGQSTDEMGEIEVTEEGTEEGTCTFPLVS